MEASEWFYLKEYHTRISYQVVINP
jgi:hypothetical protein